MATREIRRKRTTRVRTEGKTSVVGSTLGDTAGLGVRRLPRGGIRERDGLKVAEGALPDSTAMREVDGASVGRRVLRIVAIVSGTLLVLVVVAAIALLLLSHTGAFEISKVEAFESDHLTSEEIVRLANLEEGTTLLNVDVSDIEEGIKKNPWVSSVEISRSFPDTLSIRVNERRPGTLVSMGTGGTTWLMGSDGVWIEPHPLAIGENEAAEDVALAEAENLGVVLICNVPGSVEPAAGYPTTDESILAVMTFREEFSKSFNDQIVSYSAPNGDDITCVLSSGIEVALGQPTNISTKETVARQILEDYAGQITYVNVRTPSHPTYRRVDSEYVGQGTGATGSSTDPTDFAQLNAPEEQTNAYGYGTGYGTSDTTGTGYDATGTGYDATGTGYDATGTGYDATGTGYGTTGTGYGTTDSTSYGGTTDTTQVW